VSLSPWLVTGDAAALERAAVNLLDNAIKFSPPGTSIDVTLADGTLQVADRGAGVSSDEGRQAVERFWRSARARARPGSGLGLSIVSDVAHHHGGRATLEPRPGGGAVATLHLPGWSTP
jgi:two-component system sensor histidine kinase MprB